MTKDTLDACPIDRPRPSARKKQHLCLDKGYDYPEVDELVDEFGFTGHIRRRGEDPTKRNPILGYRARRWVVERTHSWMNRFRRILIRWEKKIENYLAMLHFTCAFITYRRAGLFS